MGSGPNEAEIITKGKKIVKYNWKQIGKRKKLESKHQKTKRKIWKERNREIMENTM